MARFPGRYFPPLDIWSGGVKGLRLMALADVDVDVNVASMDADVIRLVADWMASLRD